MHESRMQLGLLHDVNSCMLLLKREMDAAKDLQRAEHFATVMQTVEHLRRAQMDASTQETLSFFDPLTIELMRIRNQIVHKQQLLFDFPAEFVVARNDLSPPEDAARRRERVLLLFSFILSRKTRSRVFEPAFQDLKQDWLVANAEAQSGVDRKWIRFCFSLRSLLLILGSLSSAAQGRLSWLFPTTIRAWAIWKLWS